MASPRSQKLKRLAPRKGGTRKGDRAAKSLETGDYEESMLGRDLDGGSLEREGYSLDIGGSETDHDDYDNDDMFCGECEDDDCIYGPDHACKDYVYDASQEASSHLPEEGRVSRNALMLEDGDKVDAGDDYELEDVKGHVEQVAPLIVDEEGWPIEPPGLATPIGGQPPAQSAQAAAKYMFPHASAEFVLRASSQPFVPTHVSALVVCPHHAPATDLIFSSTLICSSSPTLFCESTPENSHLPFHGLSNQSVEDEDSIDVTVRKQMFEQRCDSGHLGKGMNEVRGQEGKGRVVSTGQLGMFGIGNSAGVRTGEEQQATAGKQPAPVPAPAAT